MTFEMEPRHSRLSVAGGTVVLLCIFGTLGLLLVTRIGRGASSGVLPQATLSFPVRYATDRESGRWLAGRLREAGIAIAGDTGSALVVRGGVDVWANSISNLKTDPQVGPFEYPMKGYDRIGDVGGVDVFSDSVRVSWDTPTYRLWAASSSTRPLPELDQIGSLVRATWSTRGSDAGKALAQVECEQGEVASMLNVANAGGGGRGDPAEVVRRSFSMHLEPADEVGVVGTGTEDHRFYVRRDGRTVIAGDVFGTPEEGWSVNNIESCSTGGR